MKYLLLILLFAGFTAKAQLTPDSVVRLFQDPSALSKLHKDSTVENKTFYTGYRYTIVAYRGVSGRVTVLEYHTKDKAEHKCWYLDVPDQGWAYLDSITGETGDILTEYTKDNLQLIIRMYDGDFSINVMDKI
jgi:hypothetical protein